MSDDGRGVPVDIHEQEGIPAERVVYTVLHAGGKFNSSTYKISGGLHGVGSAVVNALSNKLIVDVARDGYLYHDTYEKGIPTTEQVQLSVFPSRMYRDRGGMATSITIHTRREYRQLNLLMVCFQRQNSRKREQVRR